jgi:hypothetical protein
MVILTIFNKVDIIPILESQEIEDPQWWVAGLESKLGLPVLLSDELNSELGLGQDLVPT